MKVKARPEKALQSQNAVVRILTRIGHDAVIADPERATGRALHSFSAPIITNGGKLGAPNKTRSDLG
jgi:hypothetical protein